MIIKNTNILIALLIVLLGVLYILNKEQLNEGFTTGVGSSSSSSGAGATSTIKEEVYIVIPNATVIESNTDASGGTIVSGGYDDRAKIAQQLGGRLATIGELNDFNNPGGAKWYRGTIASGDNLMRYTAPGSGINRPVYTSILYDAKWAPGFAVYGFKPSATQIPHSVFKNLTTTPTKITSRLPGYDMTNGKMDILGYQTDASGITITKYATKDLTGATKTPAPTDSDKDSKGIKRFDDLSTSFVNYKPPQNNCNNILKPEVYLVTANKSIVINDLQIFARKFNGRVATRGQFNTAYTEKAQWCAGGAFTDPSGVPADSSGNKYSFGYPIQDNTFLLKQYPYKPDTWGWCGGSGQQNISNTIPQISYGVLIYGVKPQSIQPGYTITINGTIYSDLKIWNFFDNSGQDTTSEKYYQCNNATNDDRIKLENISNSPSSAKSVGSSSSSSAQIPPNSTFDLIRNIPDDSTNSEVYYVTGPSAAAMKDKEKLIADALGATYATAAQVKRWHKQGGRLWRAGTVSDSQYMYFTDSENNGDFIIEPYNPDSNPAIILYGLKPASRVIPGGFQNNNITIPFDLTISPFKEVYGPFDSTLGEYPVLSQQKYRKTDAKDTDAFRITVSLPGSSSSSAQPASSSASAQQIGSSSSSAQVPRNSSFNLIIEDRTEDNTNEVYFVNASQENKSMKDNAQKIATALGAKVATAGQVKYWFNQGGRVNKASSVADSEYMYYTGNERDSAENEFMSVLYSNTWNPGLVLYGFKPASKIISKGYNGIPFDLLILPFKEKRGSNTEQYYKKRDAKDDDTYGWDNTPRIKIPTDASSALAAAGSKAQGSSSSAKAPPQARGSSSSSFAPLQGSSSSYYTNLEDQDMSNLGDNINTIDEDLCSCLPNISDSDISSALEQTWDNVVHKLKKKAKKEGFMLYDRFTRVNSRYQMQQYQNNLY